MSTTITAAAATVKGFVGVGAVLAIGAASTGTMSTTFQAIGGVQDIVPSGVKLGTATSTDLSSRNVRRLGTTLDYGTVTATLKNAFSDAGQTAASAAQLAAVPYDFCIQYVDPYTDSTVTTAQTVTITFSALVTEFGAADLNDTKENTSKIELSLDGGWSISAVAVA